MSFQRNSLAKRTLRIMLNVHQSEMLESFSHSVGVWIVFVLVPVGTQSISTSNKMPV